MVKISKLFFLYVILLILIGLKGNILISLIFVFLHELVHNVIAKKFHFKGYYIEIMPIGTVLNLKDLNDAEPFEDFVISIAGPIFNVLCGVFFWGVSKFFLVDWQIIKDIYLSNFALGIFNLIPAFPLDGGRIARDILQTRTIYKRANKIAVKISVVSGICVFIIFILTAVFNKINISILIMSIFILFSTYKERERIVYVIMSDIVKKRLKFLDRGYMENRQLSVSYSWDLLKLLSIVDKNKYNIFSVLNSDMEYVGTIYEAEVIQALKLYGNISIEEYIGIKKYNDEERAINKLTEKSIEEWEDWADN
ncbi:M50 family metallopeptidase [Clostridium sp. DL1XJH146]